jgi:hypothetical protein
VAGLSENKGHLSPHALGALACGFIWVLGLFVMYQDHHNPSSQVWDITLGPTLLVLAMFIAAPVGLYCCIVLLNRKPKQGP